MNAVALIGSSKNTKFLEFIPPKDNKYLNLRITGTLKVNLCCSIFVCLVWFFFISFTDCFFIDLFSFIL